MIKRLLLATALLLLAQPAFAQQEVQITSDLFTVDENTQEAVFTGNVVVIHPTVKVWADKVIAVYGDAGPSDIESFIASGTVKLETSEQTATGNQAVFTPGDQLMRLTGNVQVVNASGTIDAGELVVNLATNVSTFTSSGSGGRVTGVFTSQ
ncbi:MAG: LptA/OstA family protein [Devosia sp.]|jgi:lipopolysaccharide export system protein LptA